MEIFASRFEEEDEFAKEQREKTDLVFAAGYLSFIDLFLHETQKEDLRQALAFFSFGGQITATYKILDSTGLLDDDQINTILRCLINKKLRTQLIIKLVNKKLLSVLDLPLKPEKIAIQG